MASSSEWTRYFGPFPLATLAAAHPLSHVGFGDDAEVGAVGQVGTGQVGGNRASDAIVGWLIAVVSAAGGSIVSDGGSGVLSVVNGSPAWSDLTSDVTSSVNCGARTPWICPGTGPPTRVEIQGQQQQRRCEHRLVPHDGTQINNAARPGRADGRRGGTGPERLAGTEDFDAASNGPSRGLTRSPGEPVGFLGPGATPAGLSEDRGETEVLPSF